MAKKKDKASLENGPSREFEEQLAQRLRERARVLLAGQTQVLQILVAAREQIVSILVGLPSDSQQWQLSRLLTQIDDVLDGATRNAGTLFETRMQEAWRMGEDFVDKPLAAIGHAVEMLLPQLDVGILKKMQTFGSLRLKDVGREAAGKIGQQLGLVTLGAQTPFSAIKAVQSILGSDSSKRAATIVRTEVSRAFALASNERLIQASALLPELGKQWRRSGKIHSRWNHDIMDGQVVGAQDKFKVPNPEAGFDLMECPHDPKAPAEQVIHCGCVLLPWMKSWKMSTPGAQPYSEQELKLNGRKAILDQEAKRVGRRQE